MVSLLSLCVAQTTAELDTVHIVSAVPIVAAELTTSAKPDSDVDAPAAGTEIAVSFYKFVVTDILC